MDYGYSFLRTPNLVDGDPNQKIATCDLAGIKRFICPKTRGDPTKCLDCSGIRTCTPGQRAAVLLDESKRGKETKYTQVWTEERSKLQHQEELKAAKEAEAATIKPQSKTLQDIDAFREACEAGNPWIYLWEKGYSEGAIQEKMTYWVKHYPAITQEFGGKKRLMQKPRRFAPSPVPPEPEETPEVFIPEEVVEIIEPKVKGRELCIAAIAHGDPLAYLINELGKTPKNAKQRLRDWHTRYPELFQDEEPPIMPEISKPVDDGSDMVSLEEFLSGYIFDEPIQEPPAEQQPEKNINRELAELMEREATLLREIAGLQEEVWSIREKRRAIEQKLSH